jgi:hypothetical protein
MSEVRKPKTRCYVTVLSCVIASTALVNLLLPSEIRASSSADDIQNTNHYSVSEAFTEGAYLGDLRSLKETLGAAFRSGVFDENDFEKLDFSVPGDLSYGDDVRWEVFNPNGSIRATPIPQSHINALTESNGIRPIFGLRRVTTADSRIIDYLSVYIPNVKSSLCDTGTEFSLELVQVNYEFRLLEDNSQIIESPPDGIGIGCLEDSSHKVLMHYQLLSRAIKEQKSE